MYYLFSLQGMNNRPSIHDNNAVYQQETNSITPFSVASNAPPGTPTRVVQPFNYGGVSPLLRGNPPTTLAPLCPVRQTRPANDQGVSPLIPTDALIVSCMNPTISAVDRVAGQVSSNVHQTRNPQLQSVINLLTKQQAQIDKLIMNQQTTSSASPVEIDQMADWLPINDYLVFQRFNRALQNTAANPVREKLVIIPLHLSKISTTK